MRKPLRCLLTIVILGSLLTPQISFAAVKAGASCKKVGTTATFSGKKFTCVKSGKKLVWNKGVAIATPRPTVTPTPAPEPTSTPTPSVTPVVSIHAIGQNTFSTSANTCSDTMTLNNLYNYINEANTIPVVGVKIYQSSYNGALSNPFNGGNRFIKMNWGGNLYAVQIDDSGLIVSYVLCS